MSWPFRSRCMSNSPVMSGHTFPKFSGTVTQSSHKRVSFWPLSHHERITQGSDEMGPNSWGKQNLAPTRFLFHLNPLPVDIVGKFRTLWANATLWAKPLKINSIMSRFTVSRSLGAWLLSRWLKHFNEVARGIFNPDLQPSWPSDDVLSDRKSTRL